METGWPRRLGFVICESNQAGFNRPCCPRAPVDSRNARTFHNPIQRMSGPAAGQSNPRHAKTGLLRVPQAPRAKPGPRPSPTRRSRRFAVDPDAEVAKLATLPLWAPPRPTATQPDQSPPVRMTLRKWFRNEHRAPTRRASRRPTGGVVMPLRVQARACTRSSCPSASRA
jgi:hypothetical protein